MSGFDDTVVSLVAHHSGAIYEARERGLLPKLAAVRRPPQKLLDALTYCDLTTGRFGFRTTPREHLEEKLQQQRPGDPIHRAILAAYDELLASVARVQTWM
ncbi:phosphohydrolase [Mycobacteroides abscessus]|uniref:phosphohydrolase n=1 Tax=Mycobacteroides abscessus TaxID=36809 RepID=UPI001F42F3F5|nr:phosphohydrolase [Mycobacteroides abscessus]